MANKVYSAVFYHVVGAGGNTTSNFQISSAGRTIQLISLTINWQVYTQATNKRIDIETSTDQIFQLYVNEVGANIASPFIFIGGTNFFNTGEQLIFFRPGQWFYESFFCRNAINFTLYFFNLSAVVVTEQMSFIVETDEKIVYNR